VIDKRLIDAKETELTVSMATARKAIIEMEKAANDKSNFNQLVDLHKTAFKELYSIEKSMKAIFDMLRERNSR